MQLNFEIDKLSHSLEDAETGEIFSTVILLLEKTELIGLSKKTGWKFNWKTEFLAQKKQVYKLVLQTDPKSIQGLICFEKKSDHIFMHLLETAPHNFGKTKKYLGVAGNLVAFVCKLSFEYGFDGFVAFESKSKLINHYESTLGAKVLFGQRMEINTQSSIKLVNQYYPEFFNK